MKKKSRGTNKTAVILPVILVVAVLAVIFWKAINKSGNDSAMENAKQSDLQKIINKDLDANYPKTPTAVVDLYCSITKEVHGKEVTEEQVEKVYSQLRKLFSEELLANNEYNDQLKALKKEVKQYQKGKILITRYVVLQKVDQVTVYVDKDGNDCTKIPVMYTIKNNSNWGKDYEQIALKKDEDGYWKIMGMEPIEEPDIDEVENANLSEMEKIINKDLDANYPKTPTAVVDLYCSITKEVHGEEVTEKQVENVYPQLRKLFSEELLANNEYNDQLKALKKEVEQYQKDKILITRYKVLQEADQVTVYVDEDGNDCTKIPIMYTIKNGSNWGKDYEQITMKKDEDGYWKIMGMESIEEPDGDEDEK